MLSELKWCETLFSNNIETFNTLSCIPYILIGIYIILLNSKKKASWKFVLFGVLTSYLGITSIILHTFKTEFGLILDLSSMVLLSTFIILEFILNLKAKNKIVVYVSYFILLITSIMLNTSLLLILFFALISFVGLMYLILKKQEIVDIKFLKIGIALFFLGFLFWIGDYTKIYCSQNILIINGHTIWHLLTALAVFYLFKSLKVKVFKYDVFEQ